MEMDYNMLTCRAHKLLYNIIEIERDKESWIERKRASVLPTLVPPPTKLQILTRYRESCGGSL